MRKQTDYGFKTVVIGDLLVYTCKVRIDLTDIPYVPCDLIKRKETIKGLSILSFETTDAKKAKIGYHYISLICKQVAQQRLNKKYSWLQSK